MRTFRLISATLLKEVKKKVIQKRVYTRLPACYLKDKTKNNQIKQTNIPKEKKEKVSSPKSKRNTDIYREREKNNTYSHNKEERKSI